MNIQQYIYNRMYQYSKEEPVHNLNLSIVVPVVCPDDSIFENYHVFQQNGIEVIFIYTNDSTVPTIETKKIPIGNWVMVSGQSDCSFIPLIREIKKELTRKYVMLVKDIDSFTHLTVEDLSKISSNITDYKDCFISYNLLEGTTLTLAKNDIDKLLNYSLDFSLIENNSIKIIKRLLELSGLNEIGLNRDACDPYTSEECYEDCSSCKKTDLQSIKFQYYEENPLNDLFNEPLIINKIYDYKDKKQLHNQLLAYLEHFEIYELSDPTFLEKSFRKIVLVQSYNELTNIESFFENIGDIFDGIIMLDDESTDGTYEIASHEKLLLKVRKKREGFSDLENRNILLSLAFFFQVEWLCFMDFDERINLTFADLSFENDKEIDSVAFNFIHLWNDTNLYNASYPGTYQGVEKIFRMFRNIGFSQIHSGKKYHFASTPYFGKQCFDSGIIVVHHAFLYPEDRERKYYFYTKCDPLAYPHQYEYLISKQVDLKRVDQLTKEDLQRVEFNLFLEK